MGSPCASPRGSPSCCASPSGRCWRWAPAAPSRPWCASSPAPPSPVAATTLGRAGEGSETASSSRPWAGYGRPACASTPPRSSPASGGAGWRSPPTPSSASATGSIPRSARRPYGRAAELAPREDVGDWFWTPSWKQVPLAMSAGPPRPKGTAAGSSSSTTRASARRIADRLRAEGRRVATVPRARRTTGSPPHSRRTAGSPRMSSTSGG